ncbi:hypothetical protein, partial [Staphylococcus pseudintermedius]|uniref:hypothetical protein n=1 Tax=Staphylococcus pseudintermedius TaxID=283734 RepID=UPI0036F1F6D6
VKAKANLARIKATPLSDFSSQMLNGQIVHFAVDVKADAISRAQARVAELTILAKDTPTTKQQSGDKE